MIDKKTVIEIVESYLTESGPYLVDVEVKPDNRIVVDIDSDNEKSVSIEDCIALTKHIESKLDREVEDYELEVGSVGLSQPFKVLRQYKKNIGNEVEVLLKDGKKYSGVLKDADTDRIILTVEKQIKPEGAKRKVTVEEDLLFHYHEIKFTKYIIRFK
ncbi:ribosome assembly cofactor RimP [Bacteroidales bacterium OttesenSCG-928-M06]|nr:ribosome assembly cofactor RimP [Bacteroidales bacterium OttesenSCG-928-M06]